VKAHTIVKSSMVTKAQTAAAIAARGKSNRRVVITAQSVDGTVERARGPLMATSDPADRAHAHFDAHGWLVPAADEDGRAVPNLGARARRYHPSQMVTGKDGRSVAWDSAYDGWDELRREIESAGIRLSAPTMTLAVMVGTLRVGPREARMLERARRDGFSLRRGDGGGNGGGGDGGVRLRDVLEQHTKQKMTMAEKSLRTAGTLLLRQSREKRGLDGR